MHTVNLGIVAHVDAGKTSLTERLLFDTGVIDRLGSVDEGTTQTDTGDIERRRGITIRSAVAAFVVGDRQVNLIDTPGHSDFVAEVERSLDVLDGALLVISAVEGVQPHARVLMRTLSDLRLPTLIFVNKIDRPGAREGDLVAEIARRLGVRPVPLGHVTGLGTARAGARPYRRDQVAQREALALVLAENDDALLADLVDGVVPSADRVEGALRAQTAQGLVHPVLFGSALSGAGVPGLLDAIGRLLPTAPAAEPRLRARVFAIERGPDRQKVAYVRSYGGDLGARQRVTVYRGGSDSFTGQVSAVRIVSGSGEGPPRLTAGHIARIHGLPEIRIGDQIGSPDGIATGAHFARPTLETVVRARHAADAVALHAALVALADQDPMIGTRVGVDGQTSVLLYGEVQKEVIATTLLAVHGIEAEFAPTELVHLERPVGVGSGFQLIGSAFPATIGLRVEPAPAGTGLHYGLEVELGSLPLSFHQAIEDTVGHTLEQGVYGWPVTDIQVTLTHSGYWSPVSVAGDFRDLTPLVLATALGRARTRVYEPCHRFEVEAPTEALGPVTGALAQAGARIDDTLPGDAGWRIRGELPTRSVRAVRQRLPDLSRGEGTWSSQPGGDRPVTGPPPQRRRTDGNPFSRTEYTRFLAQRGVSRPPR